MASCFQFPVRLVVVSTLFLAAFTGTAALAQDMKIDGIWLPDNSRSQRTPSPLPFTEKGQELVSTWQSGRDPIEDDPGLYCQSPGMPSVMLSGAGYPVEIVIAAGQVLMLFEAHQVVRRIFLDTEHPAGTLPQRNGHSVGHWEGDTLVVDTTAIRPIYFGSIPHSDQVHVLERLRTMDNGETLVVEVTITDPVLYTEPMLIERYFTLAPEGSLMLEYECTEAMWIEHEESRGLAPFSL